ncbi:MAG TPA: histidine--tRNA ligase, partial [Solirubrobacteraceae bacterium]|nr:histidine--tRNA ligase [Solirubrobacteraceae bacterium]
MSAGLTAPRGTADVLPQQAALRLRVEQTARELLEAAGYGRIETPAFEATELFARGVGATTDIVEKEMYSFDDGGGRSLTLRPEGTAPVCRAYVEHGMHKLAAPVKLYYLESFFRAERPQAGRYRQFWQVGAEALGSDDPALDAELIVLLHQLLTALGARRLHLRLSSLGTPAARSEYREELIAYLQANSERLSETVRDRIERNPLRAFDADDPSTRAVMEHAPRLLDRLPADDLEHFAEVRRLLESVGVSYEIDTTLVRGLD